MSDANPTPTPVIVPTAASIADVISSIVSSAKTFALGFLVCMVLYGQLVNPIPGPTPTPVPIPVPVPPTPNPIPVPVPVPPTPVPPNPNPTPTVSDFFYLGRAYKQALAKAYADAWDTNFQVQAGDDLDAKLGAIKSSWDASRSAAFGASVAPELEKLAPNRKAVDQPTADALNKARADFSRGLRDAG